MGRSTSRKKPGGRTAPRAEAEPEAKAYLEQRKARIEAYERGDLPRSQLSRSERRDATQRKFDRFVTAEKAKEGRAATGAESTTWSSVTGPAVPYS